MPPRSWRFCRRRFVPIISAPSALLLLLLVVLLLLHGDCVCEASGEPTTAAAINLGVPPPLQNDDGPVIVVLPSTTKNRKRRVRRTTTDDEGQRQHGSLEQLGSNISNSNSASASASASVTTGDVARVLASSERVEPVGKDSTLSSVSTTTSTTSHAPGLRIVGGQDAKEDEYEAFGTLLAPVMPGTCVGDMNERASIVGVE